MRAFSVHPAGIFDTGLVRHVDLAIARAHGMIDKGGKPIIDPEKGWKTPEQSASTMVWATSPLPDDKGVYLTDSEVGRHLAEDDDDKLDNDSVKDPVNAGRLWRLCEELTGARLD